MGLPGWPGGDPDKIRDAATAWKTFATAVTGVVDDADPAMQTAFADWKGQAATKFETSWNQFVKAHRDAAEGATSVAEQLDDFAEKLDEAHKKYEHMVEVMAATAVVGFGLALLTGGLSAAAGAATEAAVAAEVADLLIELGVELETAASIATSAAEAAGGAAQAAVGAAINFTIGFGLSVGSQGLESELDGEGFKVAWDQAALVGVTAAVLGPLMDGKSLPVRIALGAGVSGASGALSQLDNLLLHGGLKDGESFSLERLLVDIAAGGVQGRFAEGPEAPEIDADLKTLQKMVDGLADDPDVAAMIQSNPDWLDIYATDPDIMRVIASTKASGTTFAVSPAGVTEIVSTVRSVVVDVKAPASLSTYTAQAVTKKLIETGADVSKEDIKKAMEFTIEESGGPKAVAAMSPAELKSLADQIVAGMSQPAAKAH